MQKYILGLFCIVFFGMVYWENIQNTWINTENILVPGEVKTFEQNLWINTDIQNIKIRFCNEMEQDKFTTELSLKIQPWQSKEICMVFVNNSNTTWNIILGFSKWTKNNTWEISYENDMSDKNDFSKYIQNFPTTWILVPANGNVIKKVKYYASKNTSGQIIWCASFKMNQEEKIEEGKMFLIITRKIAPITITITWPIYKFQWRDSIDDNQKSTILKVIIAILSILIIINIFKKDKKKNKNHK